MLKKTILLIPILTWSLSVTWAQDMKYPVINTFGGIYDIPEATVRPGAKQEYKVVMLTTVTTYQLKGYAFLAF